MHIIHNTYTKNSVFILRKPICIDYTISPKAVDCCDDNIQHLNWFLPQNREKKIETKIKQQCLQQQIEN